MVIVKEKKFMYEYEGVVTIKWENKNFQLLMGEGGGQ